MAQRGLRREIGDVIRTEASVGIRYLPLSPVSILERNYGVSAGFKVHNQWNGSFLKLLQNYHGLELHDSGKNISYTQSVPHPPPPITA